jgi:arylsulfatase A-like enzyme
MWLVRRKPSWKPIIGCTLLLLAACNACPAEERPNIVWLISEDNSTHYLKMFDPHGAETPAIRQLAAGGLTFRNAFSNAPVCSVARTTLMTSCYAPRIGTQYHRRSIEVPMPPGVKMFPAYLREAGYFTTNRQKKDYNATETKGTWDASSRNATWRDRAEGQPFFHMQSFATTHESSLHFNEDDFKQLKTTTDPKSVFVPPYFPDTDLFRYTIARYHDKIQAMDQQIAAVVRQLEEDGLLQDTFIFYFGDHGGVLPRGKGYAYESGLHVPLVVHVPKNFANLSPWEIATEVEGFVEFIDFGATALQLAGIEPPKGVDGQAFLGKGVSASEVDMRREALGYADRFDEKVDFVRTLRRGDFEYVRNYQPFNFDGLQNNYRYKMLAYREWRELFREGKLDPIQSQFFLPRPVEQLFNVVDDPHEVRNLAEDPNYANVLKELRDSLRRQLQQLPDLSFFPESELAQEAFGNPVPFGQQHQSRIGQLIDIADLTLEPYAKVRSQLTVALRSADAMKRYWGLIACSCFGKEAEELRPAIESCLAEDNLLVRVRAAECLALHFGVDPNKVILECLSQSRSGIETNLILNTAVLLRDGAGYEIAVNESDVRAESLNHQDVRRRLAYFAAEDGIPEDPRGVKPRQQRARNKGN